MKNRKKPLKKYLLILVTSLLVIFAGIYFWASRNDQPDTENTAASEQPAPEQEPLEPAYVTPDLQPTVDSWITKYPADYSISIYDLQSNTVVAENNPEESIFSASLYKLYIAYLSLLDFQSGDQDPAEIIIAGQTKKECVDKMIRESDSPCGEAMMADIGQATLTNRVASIDMNATVFNGITTSASDSVKLLTLIDQDKNLEQSNREFLLDAMLTQPAKYKRGLQSGAPDAKWYTKVGWNLDINYHDIGILELPDGKKFAVAILGQGSGSPVPIANFADTIYTALTAQ